MNAKDAIKYVLAGNQGILKSFLADLSDADLLVRSVPGANHAAWQLGHLIAGEVFLLGGLGIKTAELPAGFGEKHGKETAGSDDPKLFLKKQDYLDLLDKVRAVTLTTLDGLSDADLDKPVTGPMKDFAPKWGDMFLLVGNHIMMHAAQLTVLRRKLGKPVLF